MHTDAAPWPLRDRPGEGSRVERESEPSSSDAEGCVTALDSADFTRLYRTHAQALLVFFQRRVADPETATDLVAETFATAIERAPQFRGDAEGEAGGWIWRIAQTRLREYERLVAAEERRRQKLGYERRALTDTEIERIEELAGMARIRAVLDEQLSRLPSDQAEAMRLRIVEELSFREVGERLGIAEVAARARVSRGLRMLNGILERRHQDWGGE